MIFCLVKFFNRESHAANFRRGTLFARRLSYFRKLEEKGRGDPTEGTIANHQGNRVDVEINGMKLDGLEHIRIASNAVLDLNVFCMTAIHSEDVEDPVEDLDVLRERIVRPQGYLQFGEFAVVVTKVAEFVKRVDQAVKTRAYGYGRNLVEYYDPATFHGWFDGAEAAFKKPKAFADQREYRFVFGTDAKGPFHLEIGDIHDITMPMKSSEILEKVQFVPRRVPK